MSGDKHAHVVRVLRETAAAHERMTAHADAVVTAAGVMVRALNEGRTIWAFGNGGSAADAQHFVAELVGHRGGEIPRVPQRVDALERVAAVAVVGGRPDGEVLREPLGGRDEFPAGGGLGGELHRHC